MGPIGYVANSYGQWAFPEIQIDPPIQLTATESNGPKLNGANFAATSICFIIEILKKKRKIKNINFLVKI